MYREKNKKSEILIYVQEISRAGQTSKGQSKRKNGT